MSSFAFLAFSMIQWPREIIATCPASNWLSIVLLPGIGDTLSTWIRSWRNCSVSATLGSSMFDAVQSALSGDVPLVRNQGWTKKFWLGTSYPYWVTLPAASYFVSFFAASRNSSQVQFFG